MSVVVLGVVEEATLVGISFPSTKAEEISTTRAALRCWEPPTADLGGFARRGPLRRILELYPGSAATDPRGVGGDAPAVLPGVFPGAAGASRDEDLPRAR